MKETLFSESIKAEGNVLTFGSKQAVIFDPTGSHGAENALSAMRSVYRMPLSNSYLVVLAIGELMVRTNGQFELMALNANAQGTPCNDYCQSWLKRQWIKLIELLLK
ncbi:hypothetical protein [Aliagarivorans taiwanensis]|uniref:hypothetical protein n=1 Tax=Aliagarivorans taiwanensis TaxID=561966 RepID=UPI0004791653|nr:hypothetical protein [Aliagarivorans taiwanensis]